MLSWSTSVCELSSSVTCSSLTLRDVVLPRQGLQQVHAGLRLFKRLGLFMIEPPAVWMCVDLMFLYPISVITQQLLGLVSFCRCFFLFKGKFLILSPWWLFLKLFTLFGPELVAVWNLWNAQATATRGQLDLGQTQNQRAFIERLQNGFWSSEIGISGDKLVSHLTN